MRGLLRYLREHPLVWIVPLVLLAGLLGALAWKVATTPHSPLAYDTR